MAILDFRFFLKRDLTFSFILDTLSRRLVFIVIREGISVITDRLSILIKRINLIFLVNRSGKLRAIIIRSSYRRNASRDISSILSAYSPYIRPRYYTLGLLIVLIVVTIVNTYSFKETFYRGY